MGKYVILGAGISGCSAAYELAELGHEVTVVEKDSLIGGKVITYCCKATDSCSRCGVCMAHTKIRETLEHENIRFLTGAEIDRYSKGSKGHRVAISRKNPVLFSSSCSGCGACVTACPEGAITLYNRGGVVQISLDYSKCRIHRGEECRICAEACSAAKAIQIEGATQHETIDAEGFLIATGHEAFNPQEKPRYGYGRWRHVYTGAEAEEMLTEQRYLVKKDARIAFIQCVGSRDPLIRRNYCSAVCCSYAFRLARMVKYWNPGAEAVIYYIDLQNFDKEFTHFKKEALDLGVTLVRGIPFLVEENESGELRLLIENGGEVKDEALYDGVVLSVGLGPQNEADKVADMVGLERDSFGFFKENGAVDLYTTGTCSAPMTIPDSMTMARSIAAQLEQKSHE